MAAATHHSTYAEYVLLAWQSSTLKTPVGYSGQSRRHSRPVLDRHVTRRTERSHDPRVPPPLHADADRLRQETGEPACSRRTAHCPRQLRLAAARADSIAQSPGPELQTRRRCWPLLPCSRPSPAPQSHTSAISAHKKAASLPTRPAATLTHRDTSTAPHNPVVRYQTHCRHNRCGRLTHLGAKKKPEDSISALSSGWWKDATRLSAGQHRDNPGMHQNMTPILNHFRQI